jgi:hypothetical protein
MRKEMNAGLGMNGALKLWRRGHEEASGLNYHYRTKRIFFLTDLLVEGHEYLVSYHEKTCEEIHRGFACDYGSCLACVCFLASPAVVAVDSTRHGR